MRDLVATSAPPQVPVPSSHPPDQNSWLKAALPVPPTRSSRGGQGRNWAQPVPAVFTASLHPHDPVSPQTSAPLPDKSNS